MLLEFWSSFRDNFRQKSRNPFFGTLIIVWVVKNWKLVYALFYFDSTYTLAKRIEYIEVYYKNTDFFWNLMYCLWLTVLSLIGSYLLLNISRLIINLYEKKLTPWIYKLTDKNTVVLKTDYDKLKTQFTSLSKRYDDEKKKRIDLANENEELEKKNALFQDEINGLLLRLSNEEKADLTAELSIDNLVENQDQVHVYEKTNKFFEVIYKDLGFRNSFKKLIIANSEKGYIEYSDISDTKHKIQNETFKDFIFENEILKPINKSAYNFSELGLKIKQLYQAKK